MPFFQLFDTQLIYFGRNDGCHQSGDVAASLNWSKLKLEMKLW